MLNQLKVNSKIRLYVVKKGNNCITGVKYFAGNKYFYTFEEVILIGVLNNYIGPSAISRWPSFLC
jgi:hypothetical protein